MLVDSYKHRGLRKSLIKTLRSKGIEDERLLDAFNAVPRHYFFDDAFLEHAYQDKAFPIGEGQTISQPYTVAIQTALLEIKEGEKVLEIGTGSGYQACILMELGANVFSIEYNKKLYEKAKSFLRMMGYRPHLKNADGTKGWPTMAPFDKILVTAGAPSVPQALIDQLKPGGILVIPVGSKNLQKMIRIVKTPTGKIETKEFNNFSFVPLLGEKGWKK
jgi:protein-L-isoaspartate(D-aspartate) O-methyltransferase